MAWLKIVVFGYVLYAAFLAAQPLLDAQPWMPGALIFGRMLVPLVGLAIALLALRHAESEPFACTVALAGVETSRLAGMLLSGDSPPALWQVLPSVLLWTAALVAARSGRIAQDWSSGKGYDPGRAPETRTVLAIVGIFAGSLGALLAFRDAEPLVIAFGFYGTVCLLGVMGALLLGPGQVVQTAPVSVRLSMLAPTIVVTAAALLLLWWHISLREGTWGLRELWPHSVDALPLLFFTLLPAVTEEWLCRGVLWAAVRRCAGLGATVVVTATLFAVLHRVGDARAGALPAQILHGILLGALRARAGSLVPCMFLHALSNGLVISLL